MAEIDKELVGQLRLAKSKPMFFAFVAKGTESRLLLGTKKIPPPNVAKAKKDAGGGTIFAGSCFGEEEKMVFEISDELPETLADQIKKAIHATTGLTLDISARTITPPKGQAELPKATETTAPTAADITKRINALGAGIKAAIAGPNGTQVQKLFGSLNPLLQSKDFEKAANVLEVLEPLVASAIAAEKATSGQTAPGGGGDLKAAFAKYQAARNTVIAQLERLYAALKEDKHPAVAQAIIQVRAIQANIPANPETPQKVNELITYLETDDVVADADEPNRFGIELNIQVPLLEALDEIKLSQPA